MEQPKAERNPNKENEAYLQDVLENSVSESEVESSLFQ